MKKGKNILVKFLIVIISFLCIDGSRSLLFDSNNISILLNHNHINDIEGPHQSLTVNSNDEEKLLETFRFDFSGLHDYSIIFLYTLNNPTREFSDSIWQPPKFV